MMPRVLLSVCVCAVAVAALAAGGEAALPLVVVDTRTTPAAPYPDLIAVQACTGLYNRAAAQPGASGPRVYTVLDTGDVAWLHTPGIVVPAGATPPASTPSATFLRACYSDPHAGARRFLVYNYSTQRALMPNIVTLAGVLDAVPVERAMLPPGTNASAVVLDLAVVFAGFTPLQATEWVFDRYANLTSTVSKTNPGYTDEQQHPFHPTLTGHIQVGLIDYIVSQRLFNFYLVEGCIRDTDEYRFVEKMVTSPVPHWPRPIAVYGYDNTFPLAGDLFEAETDCTKAHNMGQIASDGTSNLSFLSWEPTVATPVLQNPTQRDIVYNKSLTYLSLILGDGDNMNFVKGSRRDWMSARVSHCTANASACFPLVWSLSPHLLHLSPSIMRWYYAQATGTGHDYFVLPPSGHLYAYPSEMPADVQQSFVELTQADAFLMNTSGTVSWEFFGSWGKALREYFPRYTNRSQTSVRGFFPVNVPYLFPVPEFFGVPYKILGEGADRVVVFSPREWRGDGCKQAAYCQTPAKLAEELNAEAPGTVTSIYVTSDGGANFAGVVEMASGLEDHVRFVDQDAIVALALQREEAQAQSQ